MQLASYRYLHALLLFALTMVPIDLRAQKTADAPTTLGKPQIEILERGMDGARRQQMLATAQRFYRFWNTGDATLLAQAVALSFLDHDLPAGRPQGPGGPLFAFRNFTEAVPDLRCEVLQQIVAGDRVVSNLRFTGHFTGTFGQRHGAHQSVDFVATDILRVNEHGQITDNWHLEDNLTFLQQIGAVQRL